MTAIPWRQRALVLSLFPGLDVLGMGFQAEGFCVVQGPDVIWGRDVRDFHPPAGVFDGVVGGPPCQAFSSLANLVRAKGLTPRFGNLIPDFARVVEESEAGWFLMENVPQAPEPKPLGYDVRSFLLDHCTLDSGDGTGHEQMRRRSFWFGMRKTGCQRHPPAAAAEILSHDTWATREGRCTCECPELRRWIDFALFELPEKQQATAVGGHDGVIPGPLTGEARARWKARQAPVTGHNDGRVGAPDRDYSPPRRSLAEMLELQGLPPDLLDEAPYTMQGKRKLVGNAVPLPMARAVARAVRKALA